jgi:hypothetical protein
MNMTRLWLPCLLIGALGSLTIAEDAPPAESPPAGEEAPAEARADYAWQVSGETVDDINVELKLGFEWSQATPEAAVTAYLALADNREETAKANDAVGKEFESRVEASLATLEAGLLSESAREALAEARKQRNEQPEQESAYSERREPSRLVKQEAGPDDSVWVECTQMLHIRTQHWQTREWESREETERMRFRCVKGQDEQWRIAQIQREVEEWQDDAPVKTWQDDAGPEGFYLYEVNRELAKAAGELKTDSPATVANALYTHLFTQRGHLEHRVLRIALRDLVGALRKLCTPEYLKAAEERIRQEFDGEDRLEMYARPRGVESVAPGEDGVQIVTLKPADDWGHRSVVHVKQMEAGWRIVAAGYFEQVWNDEGEAEEKLTMVKDVYELQWR